MPLEQKKAVHAGVITVSEFPDKAPVLFPNSPREQGMLDQWYFELRTVFLRQADALAMALQQVSPTATETADTEEEEESGLELGDGVVTTADFGQAAKPGTGTKAAREDHEHPLPENPLPAHIAAEHPHSQYLRRSDLEDAEDPVGLIIALG